MKHLLKERKGRDVVAKCLATPTIEETTAWHTDVTCPVCLDMMERDLIRNMSMDEYKVMRNDLLKLRDAALPPEPPRRRLVRKRGMIYECGPRTS